MRKLSPEELQKSRWLRALGIAKVMFESEGYFTDYLCEIERFINENKGDNGYTPQQGKAS